jgi:signal transduction histidine kinase
MDKEDNIILIISVVLMLVFLIGLMFTLFIIFNKRKEKYIIERETAKRAYEMELADSKVEIQEQIMKNISWELHDNIGQLLSVSKMQLNMIGRQASDDDQKALDDCNSIIGEALMDIRQLSKTLNNDYIKFNGIVKAIELEIERFNRLKYLDAYFTITGTQKILYVSDYTRAAFECNQAFKGKNIEYKFCIWS